jgi:hypothetical protein
MSSLLDSIDEDTPEQPGEVIVIKSITGSNGHHA